MRIKSLTLALVCLISSQGAAEITLGCQNKSRSCNYGSIQSCRPLAM